MSRLACACLAWFALASATAHADRMQFAWETVPDTGRQRPKRVYLRATSASWLADDGRARWSYTLPKRLQQVEWVEEEWIGKQPPERQQELVARHFAVLVRNDAVILAA